jgi:hypothetical protein
LLKLCDVAKSFIWFKVSNGSRIFMWFDQWHSFTFPLDKFGHQVVYDSSFSNGAKLSTIIRD